MFKERRLLCLFGLNLVLPFLLSCGSRSHSEEKYFLISANLRVAYWQAAAAGFTKAASELQVTAEVVGPDTYDPMAEHREFQRIIQMQPAGILVSAADPLLLKPDIDAAIAAGIPVITMDSDSPTSKRLLFIGTNNYQAGLLGGRITAQELQGRGNVVVFTMPGQANLDERFRGYFEAFAGYPQIKVVRVVDIRGDPRLAFEAATEILRKQKDSVDAFVCLEALAGKEIASVLSGNNVKGKTITSMDTDPDTLQWIRKGVIGATIAQKPFTMGFVGMKMLDDLHHHKLEPLDAEWAKDPFAPIPSFVDTGTTLVEPKNVEGFIRAQESRSRFRR